MAHVHTFGAAAPSAAPIIHLGATSCYVGQFSYLNYRDLIRKFMKVGRKLLFLTSKIKKLLYTEFRT